MILLFIQKIKCLFMLPASIFSLPFHRQNIFIAQIISVSIYTLHYSSDARSIPRAPASLLFYSLPAFISPYSSISAILSHACPSPYGFAACDIFSYSSWLSRSFVNSL